MVEFNFISTATLRNRKNLKSFISKMIAAEGFQPGRLGVNFCSDKFLLNINKTYLNHNDYTDIITFDYSDNKGEVSGEMYISIDRVRENAKTFGVTVEQELHRVIFHGILHLLGYSDKSPAAQKQMRQMEDRWLKKYFGSR